jgi:hypothetical protein
MSQVIKINEPSTALTPMDMIDRALSSGASVETLGKLMELQERWDRNQAAKEFNAAIAAAKAEIKPIARNKTGHNSKKYADLAATATAVDPILSKHGLGYRYRSTQADRITVTCVLFHRSGHQEETTLTGPADTTGNKNAIQAIGSTLTYLERYSLFLALGLAAGNDDDGAAGGAGETIGAEQIEELQTLIFEVAGERSNHLLNRVCQYLKVTALDDIRPRDMNDARTAINGQRKNYAK